jgi:endonuclease/exonuclease/phosphatase family metal-dependent hydrolase
MMIYRQKPLALVALGLFFYTLNIELKAQALPIAIDGSYDDWTTGAVFLEDATGDVAGLDLLNLSVANDEKYLFLRLEIDEQVVLTDNNDLTLFIDGDNNGLTGLAINGIGAELELRFGDREGRFYFGNSSTTISLEDVGLHSLPNFSNEVFEMAIARDAKPNGVAQLFTNNAIRIYIRNGVSGDKMPNQGQTFSFQFDEDAVTAFQPIDLHKISTNQIRLLTWNVLNDGLLDNARKPFFTKILKILQPDIITFNECWDMTAGQAASYINAALPLGNLQSWKSVKLLDGNITVSRWPILQSWEIYPGHRLMAALIDLPDAQYNKDFMVVNGHLRCCSANSERQLEADAFAEFILDAKTNGGEIDLPEGTPFVLSGDMNLVGWRKQYETLVKGDVVNTNAFGNGGPLDWDGTDLLDVVALQADQRMAHTWQEAGSQYPPSRLDFHFCSNSVLEVKKAFTLNTEIMSSQRLDVYGLGEADTRNASDHFPKVTDFDMIGSTTTTANAQQKIDLKASPNPAASFTELHWKQPKAGEVLFALRQMDGRPLRSWKAFIAEGDAAQTIDFTRLPAGAYLLEMNMEGKMVGLVLMKK